MDAPPPVPIGALPTQPDSMGVRETETQSRVYVNGRRL